MKGHLLRSFFFQIRNFKFVLFLFFCRFLVGCSQLFGHFLFFPFLFFFQGSFLSAAKLFGRFLIVLVFVFFLFFLILFFLILFFITFPYLGKDEQNDQKQNGKSDDHDSLSALRRHRQKADHRNRDDHFAHGCSHGNFRRVSTDHIFYGCGSGSGVEGLYRIDILSGIVINQDFVSRRNR